MRLFRWAIEPKGKETTLSMSPGCRVVAAHSGVGEKGQWLGLTILDPCVNPLMEYTFRTFEEDGEPIPPEWVFVVASTGPIQPWYVFQKSEPAKDYDAP